MIGALWTGISGLSSQQQALDNESNNIANVNTIGYKASRISFADQMYQDRIGKGSKILDAEKLYTQGGLKLTGVNYDMALSGDGFFTVMNNRNSGTSETLYTRAGNFRMGDNGTLQDAAGNEVQGWSMTAIDSKNDVTSTNPNVSIFTSDYSNMISSKIIKHGNYVETITAKSTDYSATAKSDSSTAFSGAGLKTKGAKESDIEAAIKDYTNWLKKLQDEPDGVSAASVPQVTQINFKTGSNGIVSKDSDQIYVYINGNKISQNYVVTSATQTDRVDLWNGLTATQRTSSGLVDPATLIPAPSPTTATYEASIAAYDREMSRIATYKALADKISGIAGLVAYNSSETSTSGNDDVLEMSDTFAPSTKLADMYKGIIQIKSLIPGTEFTISEVAEVSSNTTNQGNYLTTTTAKAGSGTGALESSRDALSKLITGKQQDVYTMTDLNLSKSPMFKYSINIYDKELDKTIPVPNNGNIPPLEVPLFIDATDFNGNFTIDGFVQQFNQQGANTSPKLTDYVEAVNINGNLVIKTLDKNFDVEFSGGMKQLPTYSIDLKEVVDNSKYTFNVDINGNSYPIEIDYLSNNTVSDVFAYQDIRDKIKLGIDAINLANPTYQLEVTQQANGVFSVYTKNENIDFSNSTTDIIDTLPTVSSLNINPITIPSVTYEKDKITVNEPLLPQVYSFNIMGVPVSYDNTGGTATSADDIINSFRTQITSNPSLAPYINASNNDNVIGTPGDGVVLINGLNNMIDYSSVSSGRFMIEIPTGTTNMTLFLYDNGANDTFQVFTKDGEHISGTVAGHSSWGSNKPEDILTLNSDKFNLGATYKDNHTLYTLNSPRENIGLSTVSYIDKNGDNQSKDLGPYNEMVVIPTVAEDLVVFVNGSGMYYVSAEWASKTSTGTGSSSLVLTQTSSSNPLTPTGLNISSLQGVVDEDITDFSSTATFEHRFTITTDDTNSSSIYKLILDGQTFEIKTDQTPTRTEILDAFNVELAQNNVLNEKFEFSIDGNDFVIREKYSSNGYVGFSQNSSLVIKSLEVQFDQYPTVITKASKILPIDANLNYSGRAGAGAEFIEIVNKVDQTASKNSLQLRLDTLGISDTAFGEFAVDSTGLITMKQDGADFAIGQVAIALFNNNQGLNPMGDNLLAKTNESGDPIYNLNNNKTAKIEGKTLELSKADLSESLVNLMVFQRAFEANAKSITTSDEILTTLIGLKK